MGVFLPYNHMVFWVHFISESCTFCDLNSDFGNSQILFPLEFYHFFIEHKTQKLIRVDPNNKQPLHLIFVL